MEGHHTDPRTLPKQEGHCSRYATTHRRAHVARAPRRPPADGGTTRHPWDRLSPPGTPAMGVKPAAKRPAISRDDPGQADLAQEGPPQIPTTHGRAAHPANACRSGAPARVALDYPTSAAGTHECGPALAAQQPVLLSINTTKWPNQTHCFKVFRRGPRYPRPCNPSASGNVTQTPTRTYLTSLSHKVDTRWTKKCSPMPMNTKLLRRPQSAASCGSPQCQGT